MLKQIELVSDTFAYSSIIRQPDVPLYDVYHADARSVSEIDKPLIAVEILVAKDGQNDLARQERDMRIFVRAEAKRISPRTRFVFPKMLDSFEYDGRQAVVSHRAVGYYTIPEILRSYPEGLEPEAVAWMSNRLFEVLTFLSGMGVVHGALLPPHIAYYFGREEDEIRHTVKIVGGWAIARKYSPESGDWGRLSGKFSAYGKFYAPELPERPAPQSDLFMAVRCLRTLFGHNSIPKPFESMFMLAEAVEPSARPESMNDFRKRFRSMLERNFGGPKFHYTAMPR